MVGSLFSWKSLLTNRSTSDDYKQRISDQLLAPVWWVENKRTLPTAASPSSTSLTLLLGFGALAAADSDMTETGREVYDAKNLGSGSRAECDACQQSGDQAEG